MAKPKTIHTLESLTAKTTEEGDCRLWTGYRGNANTPMVYHDGKLIAVRKLVLQLHGVPIVGTYHGTSCGNPLCVEHSHIVQRTPKQHHKHMGKLVSRSASNAARIAKITKKKREQVGKITQDHAALIRLSDETGPVLAERYGVTKSLVNRIKAGRAWAVEFGNPFAGLGARA